MRKLFLSVAVLLAVFIAILFHMGPTAFAEPREGIDCDCTEVGDYEAGEKAKKPERKCVPPIDPDYCSSPEDIYRADLAPAGISSVTITVKRVSDNATVLTNTAPLTDLYYGFSPDDHRFVYWYYTLTATSDRECHVRLHDLLSANPNNAIYEENQIVGQAPPPLFSAKGNYLLWVNVPHTTHTLIKVVNARTGVTVWQDEFDYALPFPGDPFPEDVEIKKWGGVTWGFSAEKVEKDASFAYVWRKELNVVDWNVVNLVSGNRVKQRQTDAAGLTWEFSPCGDVISYVENQLDLFLYSTNTGTELAHETFVANPVQKIRSTASSHEALTGWDTYTELAPNTAPNDCGGELDSDTDGVPDSEDNCPNDPNADQADTDGDDVGNVCDNCPDDPNTDQTDTDDDGVGDVCDDTPTGNPPTWPAGSSLTATNVGETTVTLQWTEAEDDGQVTQYKIHQIYPSEVELVTLSATGDRTFVIENLSPYSSYGFKVQAGDNDELWSTDGPSVWVTTIDQSPPTWPAPKTLEAKDRTPTSLTIQWSEAVDNDIVQGYRIYRRVGAHWILVVQVSPEILTYHFSCLEPYRGNNPYTFKLEAFDRAGNESTDGPSETMYTEQGEECGDYTQRVSVSSNGEQGFPPELPEGGDGGEGGPDGEIPLIRTGRATAISADGRYATFACEAENLVENDTNLATDIFVHDRQTGVTTRVSVSSSAAQANDASEWPSISADGRYVAFASVSPLVPNDSGLWQDVFVHDRETGETERASLNDDGVEGNRWSHYPVISADGRYVAFSSPAQNLVPGDGNAAYPPWHIDNISDVFVYDLQNKSIERVSVSSDGLEGNVGGNMPDISADGRYVAFESYSDNLTPNDTNLCDTYSWYYGWFQMGCSDIFVHDRQTGNTERVSISSGGVQGNNHSRNSAVSGDGRFVVFESDADNLVPTDTNESRDIFLHDRQTGVTTRISVSSSGEQANDPSYCPTISADGRFVAFDSRASNLVPNDNNGANDVFVYDRLTGHVERVSVCPCAGEEGNAGSFAPALSADGLYVAFVSAASNLISDIADTNKMLDTFVHTQQNIIYVTEMGDLNGDKVVGLDDAIIALRICAGFPQTSPLELGADLNGDDKIGMAEVIYILQAVSGLRP